MRTVYLLICLTLLTHLSLAQVPTIAWQNVIGGTLSDRLKKVVQTTDGGYILGGYSNSKNTGDKTENRIGDDDYWVVKVNSSGVIEWDETIGGTGSDQLYSIEQTVDGGYILGGTSKSQISGDKTENRIGAEEDFWIVKINALGEVEWDNTIGGTGIEYLGVVHQTADGGYIVGGTSHSALSGDKTEGLVGDNDYWIVKLNSAGAVEWDETIGGIWDDWFVDVAQTADNGFIIGGYSESEAGGDKTEGIIGTEYLFDYWIVKTDQFGNVMWDKTIGGKKSDFLESLIVTADNGYLLGGFSDSNISAFKSENRIGMYDYWVIKLDENGVKEWDNTMGGSDDDYLHSICQTADNGYLVGGSSISNISGDKTENLIGLPDIDPDFWVLKLDQNGIVEWDNTIGGTDNDQLFVVLASADGNYLVGGYSSSPVSGDKNEVIGGEDYWILKLENAAVCSAPENVYADNITATSAKIHWDAVAGATKYQIWYRPATGGSWLKKNAVTTLKTISGLLPNTEYVYKMKTICGFEESPFSPIFTFTTLPLKEASMQPQISIFPNPSNGLFQITGLADHQGAGIKVLSIDNQLIFTLSVTADQSIIDISDQPPGIYFLRMETNDQIFIEKLIRQ